ncbi:glycosyltransferase [Thermomonas sp. HDW16]|uniref:glycosyltransferase n=1 Tax=Thermomonas sp. HDW16 TaxID=2714945 RepID=UPI00140C62A4|nr:glycosyltransferase [Thermomonas sp. HDW16]QIL20514.1 glycosyltransferase [Thermomonas sp. HDW16]
MKPTILVFTRYYLPGYLAGGPIRTIANMVARLGSAFNFKIVAQDRDFGAQSPYRDVRPDAWIPVQQALVRYVPPARTDMIKMAEIIRSTPHDAIYLNSFFDFRFTQQVLINRKLGRLPNRPIILAPRGEFSEGALQFKSLKKMAYIGLAKRAGLYSGLTWQASSSLEAADIERTMAVLGGNPREGTGVVGHIAVAPDLADVDGGDGAACRSGAAQRKRPGLPLRVCFLSRISPKKNLDYALRVLADVRVPVCFSIYGPIEDEAYWATCSALIDELPANIQVIQIGAVSPCQIMPTLQEHDLFLFPTHGENFGHVIHEALRAGLPLLISDQTPWQKLEDKGVGWALSLAEPREFVSRLEEVAAWSEDQHHAASQRAKRFAANVSQDPDTLDSNRRLFFDAILGADPSPNHSERSR